MPYSCNYNKIRNTLNSHIFIMKVFHNPYKCHIHVIIIKYAIYFIDYNIML